MLAGIRFHALMISRKRIPALVGLRIRVTCWCGDHGLGLRVEGSGYRVWAYGLGLGSSVYSMVPQGLNTLCIFPERIR